MSRPFLTLRVNRRAIAAAVLGNESLDVADGRHLTSNTEQAVEGAHRFVVRMIELAKPSALVVDAPPANADSTTARIVDGIKRLAHEQGLDVVFVGKPEMLAAYGTRGLRSRADLRELVAHYWPDLAVRGEVVRYVLDAAAAGLLAECRMHLERSAA